MTWRNKPPVSQERSQLDTLSDTSATFWSGQDPGPSYARQSTDSGPVRRFESSGDGHSQQANDDTLTQARERPDEADPYDIEGLLRNLSHRGKGSHYCPYRWYCDKGGISDDHTLRLFERNSAFKQV